VAPLGRLRAALRVAAQPHELQRRWLAHLTRSAETYLRSPAFLETMRLGLKTVAVTRTLQLHSIAHLLSLWGIRSPHASIEAAPGPDQTAPPRPRSAPRG